VPYCRRQTLYNHSSKGNQVIKAPDDMNMRRVTSMEHDHHVTTLVRFFANLPHLGGHAVGGGGALEASEGGVDQQEGRHHAAHGVA
jgi:hypothetical protein